ncbi:class I SAM-dependent methyltransferase [Halomicroarcula sp. GCM10025709]|uniref:class I SAM-dependent methyltransferase n=1 Tax=Halomicroarcula sp. GCM10025709 TaxID=3252669 RepID=UPI00360A8CB1
MGFVGEYEESLVHRNIQRNNPSASVVGVDIKEDLHERTDSTKSVRGDAERLPFTNRSFDTVVFAEVVEHLVDPVPVLRELRRILVPGGRLVLTTPNPMGLYRYLRWYLFDASLDADRFLGADDHVQFIDPFSLQSLLRALGYRTTETTFRNVSVPKLPTLPDWSVLTRFPIVRGGSYTCLIAVRDDESDV